MHLTYNCKYGGIAHFEIQLGKFKVVKVGSSGNYAQMCH
jgi:hypothetical protein